MKKLLIIFSIIALFSIDSLAQTKQDNGLDDAERVIKAAVLKLGGVKYTGATTLSSEGKLSIVADQRIMSFQSFVDVVVFPDKERTDFSEGGSRTIQVNYGDEGWLFEELFNRLGPQTEKQVDVFKKSLKTHFDYLLRGNWKGVAELSYGGRRQASLGKRNDVLKLEFEDGYWVEYEFADDGLPMKTLYPTTNAEGKLVNEENRFAQYILTDGVFFPFIVDHFIDGKRTYRVNYVEVRFNLQIPDSTFAMPSDAKKIKKLKI